jgi:hypothetical protein
MTSLSKQCYGAIFIPLLSFVTIPQVAAVNENVFSVNLSPKIMVK